ncbi:MAG: hypothetical protein HQ494_14430 [Rhodospirillales bacterium]|nr:hypothetical protein [Rhodospirillales bacterium]
MKEPMFWGLVFGFGVYSFAGVVTFFIARYLLNFALDVETAQILAMLLGIAAMLNTTHLLNAGEK